MTIPHRDVNVVVSADLAGTLTPLRDINCYLFSPGGSYLGISAKTDVSFNLADGNYKMRVDYFAEQ